MNADIINTEIFKADRKKFALLLFERHGRTWLLGGFFLIVTAIFFGFAIDYRIFIIVLLLIFIVAPGLLLILYFNYGLKGENFLNVLEHRIEISNDKMSVFLKLSHPDEEQDYEDWRCYEFSFSDFGNYYIGKDYVIFPFLEPKQGFIYLPVNAFASPELFSETIKRISKDEDNKR